MLNNKNKEDRVEELYENRLIVLIEDIDKGIFNQVLLTKEQFKKVSDAVLIEVIPDKNMKPGFEMVRFLVDEKKEYPSDLFIGCKSIE